MTLKEISCWLVKTFIVEFKLDTKIQTIFRNFSCTSFDESDLQNIT